MIRTTIKFSKDNYQKEYPVENVVLNGRGMYNEEFRQSATVTMTIPVHDCSLSDMVSDVGKGLGL